MQKSMILTLLLIALMLNSMVMAQLDVRDTGQTLLMRVTENGNKNFHSFPISFRKHLWYNSCKNWF